MRVSLRRWQPSLVPCSCSKPDDPACSGQTKRRFQGSEEFFVLVFISTPRPFLSKKARGKLSGDFLFGLVFTTNDSSFWGFKCPWIISSLIKIQCPPRERKPTLFFEAAGSQLSVHEELTKSKLLLHQPDSDEL